MIYFELPDLFWSHRVFPAIVCLALVAGAICSVWYKLREGDAVTKARDEGRRSAEADQRLKEKTIAELRRELTPQLRAEIKAELQAEVQAARPSGPVAPATVPHATSVAVATPVKEEPARPVLPPRTRERVVAPVAAAAAAIVATTPVAAEAVAVPDVEASVILSSPEEEADDGRVRGADPDQE